MTAEGDRDFDTAAGYDERRRLIDLTERYCVVLQTLRVAPEISVAA